MRERIIRGEHVDLNSILNWVSVYGAPALFVLLMLGIVGLPIPDETLLVFSGYLIFKGTLHAPTTWMFAFLGSICGISLSYMIGRKFGMNTVTRYGKYLHITEKQLIRIHGFFLGYGHWTLTFGYYIAGVRHFTAIVAGMSKLEFPIFAIFAWGGAAVWVSTFLAIGYFLGDKWEAAAEHAHLILKYVAAAAVIGAIGYYIYWRRNSRKMAA